MIILIVTGCSSHSQVIVKNRDCHIPKQVTLTALDNRSHLGSEKNIGIMMINIADLVAYVKSLESAIRCYNLKEIEETKK